MRFEEVQGVRIPKVGFGTWSIGGGTTPDRRREHESLAALRSALDLGYTHFDTAESYADGYCEQLLGMALQEAGIPRIRLFLTSKVRGANLSAQSVVRACEASLQRLGTEYLDLYLIHWPSDTVPLEDTFDGLNRLVQVGKVRFLGVSNFGLPLLARARELADTPILTDQVPYSYWDRSYAENGLLAYCQSADIILTAYSPLKRAPRQGDAELMRQARAHKITIQQVAIAWLCSQPRVITIPMSADPKHQRANLEAADVVLASPAPMGS
jgi:diketogulonate reductase-like aldo/keto reductase